MWIWQKIPLLTLLSIATNEGRPIGLHNYAPAHEHNSGTYSFSYGVKDPHTGDVKHQWEKKNGDTVRGHYSLVEPDGSVRTVDYTVDGKSGFNAVVKHSEPSKHKTAISHKEVLLQQPPETHFATLKESIKAKYQFDEANNEVKQYIFVPDEEDKIEAPVYFPKEVEVVKPTPKLPVDLNLVKQTTEKIIPIDVSQLTPVEIDLGHHATPHEISPQELQKFLKEYYQSEAESLNRPQFEHGFKPMKSQITVRQTYKSNKKPVTTPGLRNYASKNKHRYRVGDVRYQRAVTQRVKMI